MRYNFINVCPALLIVYLYLHEVMHNVNEMHHILQNKKPFYIQLV